MPVESGRGHCVQEMLWSTLYTLGSAQKLLEPALEPDIDSTSTKDTRPNMSEYSLLRKRVRVHLYDRNGMSLGVITGRVADVARNVPVGHSSDGSEIRKDLAYVIDIESSDPETAFRNSAGEENEGWFALQDLQVIDEDLPANISYN